VRVFFPGFGSDADIITMSSTGTLPNKMLIPSAHQMPIGANTTVIGINGQSESFACNDNACNDNSVTVDRTFPPVLASRLSESSYNSFCEEIDRVLEPMAIIKRNIEVAKIVGISFLAVCVCLIAAYFYIDIGDSGVFVIVAILVLTPILFVYLRRQLFSTQESVFDNLKDVCTRWSNETRKSAESQQISFQANANYSIQGLTRKGQVITSVLPVLSISIDVAPNDAAAAMDGLATNLTTSGGNSTAKTVKN